MRHKTVYACSIHLPLLVFLAMALPLGSCSQNEAKRRPVKYVIPNGYVGWIKITFQEPNEPGLPVEGDHVLVRIPESGILKTSSPLEYGWARDQYYYSVGEDKRALKVTSWGGGGMIWGNFNGQSVNGNHQVVQRYLQFFVGTEDEFRKHPKPPNAEQAEAVRQ